MRNRKFLPAPNNNFKNFLFGTKLHFPKILFGSHRVNICYISLALTFLLQIFSFIVAHCLSQFELIWVDFDLFFCFSSLSNWLLKNLVRLKFYCILSFVGCNYLFLVCTVLGRKGKKPLPLRFKVGVGKVIRGVSNWGFSVLTVNAMYFQNSWFCNCLLHFMRLRGDLWSTAIVGRYSHLGCNNNNFNLRSMCNYGFCSNAVGRGAADNVAGRAGGDHHSTGMGLRQEGTWGKVSFV